MISIYAPTGQAADAKNGRDSLAHRALGIAAEWGSSPAIICGDLNCSPSENGVVNAATDAGLWYDLHAFHWSKRGLPEEMTCFRNPEAQPTRIDVVLANRAATMASVDCHTVDLQLSVHRAVVTKLSLMVLL